MTLSSQARPTGAGSASPLRPQPIPPFDAPAQESDDPAREGLRRRHSRHDGPPHAPKAANPPTDQAADPPTDQAAPPRCESCDRPLALGDLACPACAPLGAPRAGQALLHWLFLLLGTGLSLGLGWWFSGAGR